MSEWYRFENFEEIPREEDFQNDIEEEVSENEEEYSVGWECPPVLGLRFMRGEEVQVPSKGDCVVVLEFWSPWCQPCIEAIPHMNKIQAKHYEKGLRIVSLISGKFGPSDVSRYAKKHGMEYSAAFPYHRRFEVEHLKNSAGSWCVPFSMVIDKKGIVRFSGHPMDEGLELMIEECLAEEDRLPIPLPLITESKEDLMKKTEYELEDILLLRRIPLKYSCEKRHLVRWILAKCADTVYYR
mmetsp:Transcript_5467/g.33787  ORF Transcript_5467/g.33787 Transcript_5467/m.33787 type:complete len:240 (-) Transcript_5467:97-816(-)|eukprot:CAMPEP_0183827504 /NCGR_PEP_ID=MMETSP0807_2-20130328/2281_1 /TAXON_ID=88271 /ORGANISM="Picocystis salinarum, Strain CCMP1897" /LENGTH=239 /DNA_ID=CAMNT_0026072663 /DNA_START=20 /DNA_END=739 /DNA_ORIENTATION=+